MDKLIEQAIKNCKINKYEKYFEQVCKEYKRLLDAENQQLNLQNVMDSQFEAYAAFCIELNRQGMKPIKYKDYLEIG